MKTILTRYTVDVGLEKNIRLAVVADLHDRNPKETLALLRKTRPELILVAGDLMERHEKGESPWTVEKMDAWQGIPRQRTWLTKCIKLLDGSLPAARGGKNHSVLAGKPSRDKKNGYRFLREATKLAPVIMGVGNHEWYFTKTDLEWMRRCGVILLDNRDCELNIGGQRVLIGGLSTRYDLKWLEKFSRKPGHKILICHHPEYDIHYVRDAGNNTFDLVVAGHTHGGQWRLFSHGGRRRGIPVFSPGQGIFPEYAYGRYGNLIVSSGVSNTTKIPRFGNPCEVVVVDLWKEKRGKSKEGN